MYMQQTLCLVTEDFNRAADFSPACLDVMLRPVFEGLAFIHFASVALLPGFDAADSKPHSLMLELTLDDGIEPKEAIARLIDAAPEVMCGLYMDQAAPSRTAAAELRKRLLLLAEPSRAAGGFVGMRDRSAVQISAEQRWFMVARSQLQAIRRRARDDGESLDAAQAVSRLVVGLQGDPGWPAMSTPPPCSWWRRPRPALLQLLMALVWVVLPVPALACIVAVLGWLTEFVLLRWPGQSLPGQEAAFVAGGVVAIAVLLTVVLVVGLMLTGVIAVSVLLVGASLVGVLLFYVVLVAAYLAIGDHGGHPAWQPGARLLEVGALVALLALWCLIRVVRREAFSRPLARGLALVGALAAAYLLGAAWNNSLALPQPLSWGALAYALPAVVAVVLIWRSGAARWYFALGLPLILLLLLLPPLVAERWPAAAGLLHRVSWTAVEARVHTAMGVLSLADLGVLVGLLGALAAAVTLRAPRRPLGVPLLGLLALLLIAHLALGALVQRLLHGTPDLWSQLVRFETYRWVLVGLALAGLFVLGLMLLAGWLLPALARRIEHLDRPKPDPKHPFVPLPPSLALVANEAEQASGASHMISLTDLRGRRWGWHWLMTWLWLHVVGASGILFYTHGLLGTAQGIQFAHWHLVQGGRRLLFVSNFDGDFGGYLDEFINGTSQGINLIWRWTTLRVRPAVALARRFPRTRLIAFSGCHNEQAFKAYARASMVPHLLRYRAYDSSSQDIERCTRLREALTGERTPHNDNLVLRLLGS